MSRSYSVQSLQYRATPQDFSTRERLTWQDGQTVQRFMSLSEFCQRYDRHRDTVLYHAQHQRIYVFRWRGQWWLDLSQSWLPPKRRVYVAPTPSPLTPKTGELESKEWFQIQTPQGNYYFQGAQPVYGVIGPSLGIDPVTHPRHNLAPQWRRPSTVTVRLRLQFEGTYRLFVMCQPDSLQRASQDLPGQVVRGRVIQRVWLPSARR